ncbi:ABC transporter ATP-binding protein [Brevibacillus sp. B_LB10_24]|uniref:ABC transporter ATP-binding protein n=1 Tax=Brevibacillus sp. B_LB10_24 TaxID=3380645 RepID=UPI0038BAB740
MNGTIIRGVNKRFGQVTALHHVDLAIKRGEFIALLGPSGCGKTTLLRLIAGFESPSAGEIWLNGELVANAESRKPPEERRIGMVFQSFALWPHMTVYENVAFPLKHQSNIAPAYKQNPEKRVKEILEMVGLGGFEQRYPNQLSGGQRQRVSLARAVVFHPSVLLMDEPLSSLDAELRIQMRKEIQEIHRELRTSIVYVTHDQSEALAMADRIVVMKEGNIEQVGTPQEIYFAPQTPFVAKFVGRANFLSGTWLNPGTFRPEIGREPIAIQSPHFFSFFQKHNLLPVRPDQISLKKCNEAAAGLVGMIANIQFQGKELIYSVQTPESQLEVITDIHTRFDFQEKVMLELQV